MSRSAPSLASAAIPAPLFPLSSLQVANRSVIAAGPAGDEMTPSARVWGLLNESPLFGELAPKEPRFDRVALRELFQKTLSVLA